MSVSEDNFLCIFPTVKEKEAKSSCSVIQLSNEDMCASQIFVGSPCD